MELRGTRRSAGTVPVSKSPAWPLLQNQNLCPWDSFVWLTSLVLSLRKQHRQARCQVLRIRDAPRDSPYPQGICGRDTDAREPATRATRSPRRKEAEEERREPGRRPPLQGAVHTPSHLTSVAQRLFPSFHRWRKKAPRRRGGDSAVTPGDHPPPQAPNSQPDRSLSPVGLERTRPRSGLP